MANPLKTSLRAAHHVDREIARMFRQYLGTKDHPRGRVLAAYRQARRAMAAVFAITDPLQRQAAALDVLYTLRQQLLDLGEKAITDAIAVGQTSVQRQLRAYAQAGIGAGAAQEWPNVAALTDGWKAAVAGQLDTAGAMIRAGAERSLIIGDTGRMGALAPGIVQRGLSGWITTGVTAGFTSWLVGQEGAEREERLARLPFEKQAIAAIDSRTTETCLLVHGQVQPLNGKFHLVGVPRFADYMDLPKFHYWCRTSAVLYRSEYDDGLTAFMQDQTRQERARRKKESTG